MAIPNTKATLISYCKRQLGYPVVEINVDDDQADDVIDDALQFFAEYHYDGTIRTYLKHQVTAAEITNQKTNTNVVSSSSGGSDSGATTWLGFSLEEVTLFSNSTLGYVFLYDAK